MWNKYFSIQKIDFGRRNWIIYYKNYYLAIHIKLTITILGDVSLFTCFFGIKLNNLKKKKKTMIVFRIYDVCSMAIAL